MPYGAQIKFAIARQTATGSGNAVTAPSSFHHIPLLTEDVGLEQQEVVSQNLIGTFDQGATFPGVQNVAGTIEVEATPKQLGALLTAVVGRPTAVTSASLQNLTYLPRTADFSATILNEPHTVYAQLADSSSAELYFDAQFDQVAFHFQQGQLLKTRVTMAGAQRAATGTGSMGITLDTQDLSGGFLWDVASISVGGTGFPNFTDLTVSINENISALYTINGSLLPYKYTRGGFRECTVQGTLLFDSRSLYNDFTSATYRRLLVTATNKRMQIQSGYYPTLTIDVPQMKITAMKPAISGPGEVSVNFTGRGIKDPSSAYVYAITMITTYAGGY
jgi:Phage tail tube protein